MKRLKHECLLGPDGETVKASWMPGKRLRLDFVGCGPAVLTKIFPDPKTNTTHMEVSYGPPDESVTHDGTGPAVLEKENGIYRLSERERSVLKLIAESRSNKDIAAELSTSVFQVEKTRQAIMQALNLHDTAALTRFAIAHKLVDV